MIAQVATTPSINSLSHAASIATPLIGAYKPYDSFAAQRSRSVHNHYLRNSDHPFWLWGFAHSGEEINIHLGTDNLNVVRGDGNNYELSRRL